MFTRPSSTMAGARPGAHRAAALAVLLLLASAGAQAASLDEATAGDFSGNWLNPTDWALTWGVDGSNLLSGSVGNSVAAGVDRDYISFTVPAGHVLGALRVGLATTVGNNGSFLGLGAGRGIAIDPTLGPGSAAGLLGYRIYGLADRGSDILDDLAVPLNGSSGFSPPLGAGSYTLWVQETARAGPYAYQFELQLNAVPEPSAPAMLAAGLLALGLLRRHRQGR
ncbi:PEP-CTERM sorting domain-containing protein [Aquabacterium sp. OR-4]|uniref:PEP-CTERM sorting domain-containing protein n=1 Tax=Aquabacterium sp. OR-4 TaxID=2978127 RepID=UPI0021B15E13|nr:PEP-CTERM sorting domain-containing protein [Aquabacterium sp. OR-4]MDT7835210.1 PEP-CTERM sorting domain-containing protein [Aquabacterium sp. OR-4]